MRRLESREKRTLIIGGIAAVAILLYSFVLAPLYGDYAKKKERIPRMEEDLRTMHTLSEQYKEMKKRMEEVQAVSSRRGPILTEIENMTRRANLSGKVVSIKPQPGVQTGGMKEDIVEIRLENVSLYDIVNFVHLLENAHLRIKKLQFKQRFDNPRLLNSTILISSVG